MKAVLPLLAVVFLSSCSVMAIKKHSPHFKNSRELEHVKGTYVAKEVKPGGPGIDERLNSTALSCRLTTFNMPAKTTLAGFLLDGLTDELDAARKLNPSGTPIAIVVKGLESDTSGFSTGSWTLDFDYVVNNKTYSVKTKTEFESAYAADTACRNTANALTDALSENFVTFFKKLPR